MAQAFRRGDGLRSPIHAFTSLNDENFVSAFLKHAEEIFAAAREGGSEDCELAILVGRDGGIHMLPAAGWELEPLRTHYGATAAYRVLREGRRVRLEARSAGGSCVLESGSPPVPAAGILQDFPQYLTIHTSY